MPEPVHVAFMANDRGTVDAFYRAAHEFLLSRTAPLQA
jgi:hypothetical protein